MPQPYLVPVRPTCSRITHSKGVSASADTSLTVPLILSFAICIPPIRRAEHTGGGKYCLRVFPHAPIRPCRYLHTLGGRAWGALFSAPRPAPSTVTRPRRGRDFALRYRRPPGPAEAACSSTRVPWASGGYAICGGRPGCEPAAPDP